MRGTVLIFALIMAGVMLGQAQNPTYYLNPNKKLTQYNFDKWTTENGLPSNSLLHIHQAKNGYLWISGYSGLIRFNGAEFKVFNNLNTDVLQSNVIRNIAEDSRGVLWLTTQGNGLVSIRNNEFKLYGTDENVLNLYRGLLVDKDDRVWAASPEAGWFYLEDEKINVINHSSPLKNIEVRSIVESKAGAIWFATLGEGLFKYENGILKSFKVPDGLLNDWVYSLYVDESDNLWIGTSKGLCYFDGKKFYNVIPEISGTVNNILKDRFGDLWIATIDGLYRQKAFSDELEYINSENGLPNNFVVDFLFDTEGNLWLTHYKGGLARIKDGKFTNYTQHGGLPGKVVNTVFEKDSTTILVGFDSGELIQINDGKIKPYKIKSDLSGNRIRHVMIDSKGYLWLSTYAGLLTISPEGVEKWFNESNGFYGTKIRLSFQDSRGNIWVGTRNNGIIKVSRGNKCRQFTVDDGLTSNLILSIEEDTNGTIWVGTSEGINGLNSISTSDLVTHYSSKDGFNSNIVFNISADKDDVLWLSTNSGLWAYKDYTFHCITTKQGLKDNSVFDMLEDNLGYCWMPYAEGVMKVNKEELNRLVDNQINQIQCRVYNKYDGLPNSECNPTAQAMKGADGKLYFATLEGLSIIDPQNVMINNFIPPVVIEELKVDNENVSLQDDLLFSPNIKRFTFRFAALSLYEPEKISFEYKLLGFEDEWIKTGDRNVSYTNLKHGEYEFIVRASNNDGIWNTTGSSLKFTIKTRFVESIFFYILVLVVSFSLVYVFYMWRISLLKKNQEELERTITVRTREITEKNEKLEYQKSEIQQQNYVLQNQKTEIEKQTLELEKQKEELKESIRSKDKIFSIISHDLRSPLGNIRNMLSLLIDKEEQFNADKKSRILENLAEITKSTFYLLDNLLNWSRSERGLMNYDPQMFLLEPIIREILSLTKPVAHKKNITMSSSVDESDLAFGDVNMVKTILRNFVENALKFTHHSGQIEIFSEVKGEFLEIGVKDNGVGMSEETIYTLIHKRDVNVTFGTNREKGSGLGLLICKEFILKNGGVFRVESEMKKGSTFFFTLKRFQI